LGLGFEPHDWVARLFDSARGAAASVLEGEAEELHMSLAVADGQKDEEKKIVV
jgi:hypothetical protein